MEQQLCYNKLALSKVDEKMETSGGLLRNRQQHRRICRNFQQVLISVNVCKKNYSFMTEVFPSKENIQGWLISDKNPSGVKCCCLNKLTLNLQLWNKTKQLNTSLKRAQAHSKKEQWQHHALGFLFISWNWGFLSRWIDI